MIHIRPLLLLCFLLHFHGIICQNNKNTDRDVLLSFKHQVTDPNNALSSWTEDSNHCTTWYGVNCSKVGNEIRVQSLSLSGLALSGKLPSNLSNLTYLNSLDISENTFHGHIPPQFSHLSFLNLLQLAFNNLTGTIPQQLGQLHLLQVLDLSVNNLTGIIPSSFGNLSSLNYLALARNSFVGEIPSELGNLHNLSTLQLSENSLSGEFPTSIFNLSSLFFLSVTNNHLSGQLPRNLGNSFPNLRTLALATNRFEGLIPDSIPNASHLQIVDLSNNRFHGTITLFNNLKNLTQLILGNNSLTSNTSLNFQFFNSLTNSTQLQILMVNDNHLGGELPSSLDNLSANLEWFCVANNRLNGSIPHGMKKFQNLTSFSFEENYFTGELPSELGTLKKLERLLVYSNKLSGEIPDIFGNLTNLFYLGIGSNQFSGRIHTSIGQCKRLNYLTLEMNKLSGNIPEEIFQLSSLRTLYLQENSLNGSLPPEFFNMEQLETMNVSNNQLTGNIPESINGFSSLKSLAMARNKFIGVIPNNIGDLTSLDTLDLSSNNLTGQIPQSLEKLKYIVRLNLSFNNLEGEVPMKGVFMNSSQVDLHGNSKLCGTSIEIMHKLGVIMCVAGKKKRSILLPIILGVTGAIVLSISMIYLLCVLIIQKKKLKEEKASLAPAPIRGLPQCISYGDIRLATNNFADENLVGKGGFGTVYKGVFTTSTGETSTLAVKVLDLKQSKASQSFNAECKALKNLRHRNLVKVVTSCTSLDYKGDEFKALVMQFMPNGTLEMSLYPGDVESGSSLTLLQRLNIAIDVASAMDYLHHDCDPLVVHCDLKPVNVLLDDDMVAHVADFGLARFLPQNPSENQSSTLGLKGSIGYIAPEYGLGGKATTCGDVYSFGIVLLEMFIAKKPTDEMFMEGLSMSKFVSANRILNVADQRLINNYEYSSQNFSSGDHSGGGGSSNDSYRDGNTNFMHKTEECIAAAIRVGLSCTSHHPKDRWTMRETLMKLQAIRQSILGL